MTYYVGNMPVGEHLAHYGTKGMKWGHRRYQNPDGSLTMAGKLRYGTVDHYRARQRMIRSAANLGAVTDRNIRKGAAGRSAIAKAGARYDRDLAAYNKARKASKPARKAARSEWYNKNKKTLRKVAIGVGTAAAIGGAAYLGYKNRGRIKDAARSFKALRTQRANAIKGYKQFGFENRGLTKFDKARIDLMRNAGNKASHLKYVAGNKARAVGYKTNAFRAKAKVNAGEAINKAKNGNFAKKASHLKYAAGNKAKAKVNAGEAINKAKGKAKNIATAAGSKASHLKYAAGNKARAVGYKANAFRAKTKVNAGEAINKAKKATRQKTSSISKRFQKPSVTGSKSPSIRFFANYPESMERAMASDRARRLRNSYIKRGAVAGGIGGAIGAPVGLYYGARHHLKKKKSRK